MLNLIDSHPYADYNLSPGTYAIKTFVEGFDGGATVSWCICHCSIRTLKSIGGESGSEIEQGNESK